VAIHARLTEAAILPEQSSEHSGVFHVREVEAKLSAMRCNTSVRSTDRGNGVVGQWVGIFSFPASVRTDAARPNINPAKRTHAVEFRFYRYNESTERWRQLTQLASDLSVLTSFFQLSAAGLARRFS
jgi:hypothetical protein